MGVVDLLLLSFSPGSALVSVVVLLLIYLYLLPTFSSQKQKQRRGPPGPKPLPFLGNMLQLDLKRLDKSFVELSKKYGSVFTVHLGSRKAVVLSGYKTVKEALVNYAEEFGEREVPTLVKEGNINHGRGNFSKKYGSVFTVYLGPKKVVVLTGYKTVKEALLKYSEEFGERAAPTIIKEANLDHGIIWGNGDSWKELRRFAFTNLKDFGMGRRACEDKIIEESQHLIQEFKKFKGEAQDTTQLINHAVSNIICSMVYGSRFDYQDPEFQTIVNQTTTRLHLLGTPQIQLYNLFPTIGKLLFPARRKMGDIVDAIRKNHLKLLKCLKETLNPQRCRGVADAFLVCQQQLEESGITNSHYNDANFLLMVMNLFSAGTETTSTTLRWGLFLMAKYPKIQAKVQEELSRVVGGRQVSVEDRQNLPFTNAVVHETQRFANVAPMNLSHRTSKDVTFQDHFIKQGTTVFPLLTSVLYDESQWEKPHAFYPAHFLDEDGKFIKRDAFMPFSAGIRMCPGESLVRMELFIFFSTLLHHFRFTPPPGVSEEELDLTPHAGATLRPQPHKLCAVSLM